MDIVVGIFFVYDEKRWMVERIDGDDVTASNSDDLVICIKESLITDVI